MIAYYFFWFVPIVKVTVYGGCGMVYVPGKYNANCPSFSLNVSLKDFLLSEICISTVVLILDERFLNLFI